jgi:nucleoside-diphosphate-sugar epimerase
MKILVTGSEGYIGTKLIKYLHETKNEIIGIDSGYFKESLTNDQYSECKIKRIYKDIRKVNEEDLENVKIIIHLASISNDPIGNEFQKITNEINFVASKKLFNLAKKMHVKKFIFASSCSIYGSSGKKKRRETDKLQPLTAYAESKVYFENFLKKNSSKKLKSVILRFATACGDSDRMRLDLVINDFVTKAYLFKKIILLSEGNSYRPFISTQDICRAIDWAIGYKPKNNFTIINAGSDRMNFKISQLAKIVASKITGTKIFINKNATSDKRTYKVDFSKFRKISGKYYPKDSLDEVINKIIHQCKRSKIIKKLTESNFYNSKLIRLNHLRFLIKNKKLNKNFYLNF